MDILLLILIIEDFFFVIVLVWLCRVVYGIEMMVVLGCRDMDGKHTSYFVLYSTTTTSPVNDDYVESIGIPE